MKKYMLCSQFLLQKKVICENTTEITQIDGNLGHCLVLKKVGDKKNHVTMPIL